jgi:hypothetical protein
MRGTPAVAPAAWNATGGLACEDAALIEYTRCMSTCDVLCDVSLFSMCDVEVPEDSTSSHSPHRPTRLRCPAVR